jgi:hypothetical protein
MPSPASATDQRSGSDPEARDAAPDANDAAPPSAGKAAASRVKPSGTTIAVPIPWARLE